jgi:hypothetical protein
MGSGNKEKQDGGKQRRNIREEKYLATLTFK